MGINPRTKGQTGEREIADAMNYQIYLAMKRHNYPEAEALKGMTTIQRNQNQSAVGGNDLTNCMGLSIEVKRQENLAVSAWWKQCVASAARNGEVPVLIYRQNRKSWQIRTQMWVSLGPSGGAQIQVIGEMDFDSFKRWFQEWAYRYIASGQEIRT